MVQPFAGKRKGALCSSGCQQEREGDSQLRDWYGKSGLNFCLFHRCLLWQVTLLTAVSVSVEKVDYMQPSLTSSLPIFCI